MFLFLYIFYGLYIYSRGPKSVFWGAGNISISSIPFTITSLFQNISSYLFTICKVLILMVRFYFYGKKKNLITCLPWLWWYLTTLDSPSPFFKDYRSTTFITILFVLLMLLRVIILLNVLIAIVRYDFFCDEKQRCWVSSMLWIIAFQPIDALSCYNPQVILMRSQVLDHNTCL